MRWLAGCLVLLFVGGCSIHPVEQEAREIVEVEEYGAPGYGFIGPRVPLYSTEAWSLSHYYEHGLPPRAPIPRGGAYDRESSQQPSQLSQVPEASSSQRAPVRHITQRASREQLIRNRERKQMVKSRQGEPTQTTRQKHLEQIRRARQKAQEDEEELDKEEISRRRKQRVKNRP